MIENSKVFPTFSVVTTILCWLESSDRLLFWSLASARGVEITKAASVFCPISRRIAAGSVISVFVTSALTTGAITTSPLSFATACLMISCAIAEEITLVATSPLTVAVGDAVVVIPSTLMPLVLTGSVGAGVVVEVFPVDGLVVPLPGFPPGFVEPPT